MFATFRPYVGLVSPLFLVACASAPRATPVVAPETPSAASSTPASVHVAVPFAENAIVDAQPGPEPKVVVDGERMLVDGEVVGSVHAILESRRLQRIDGLFLALKARREAWKTAHPNEAFPGTISYSFAADAPAFVVKSVFQTAAFAGYPNGQLVVQTARGLGHLPIDAQVPGPPSTESPTQTPSRTDGWGRIRQGATQVNGRLPPEVIQRIVRQNFGRFRLCYENGLRNDSKLAGRISVKFVIGIKGDVVSATDAGSTLPDKSVVACVVSGMKNLSFPSPEGGIVTVVYPIEFSPGD